MKAEIVSQPKTFAPVTIALTFETQAELDAVGKLFNLSPITDSIEALTGKPFRLWSIFESAGANVNQAYKTFKSLLKGQFDE